jgi:hypothetical protein
MNAPRAIAFVAMIGMLTGRSSSCAEPVLKLTISVQKPVFKIGSDVRVDVVLRNVGSQSVDLVGAPLGVLGDSVGDVHYYRAVVADEKDSPVAFTALGKRLWGEEAAPGTMFDGSAILKQPFDAGEERRHFLIVSKLYDFSKPGRYTIQVTRPSLERATALVKSNRITITIEP